MNTECTATQLEFQSFGRRRISGRFDGGRLTSDGGGLLLREVEGRLDLFARLAGCFTDHRRAGMVEHPVQALLAQRIYGLALGYEDINDHDTLRSDSLLALLVGKADLTGARRRRVRDKGYPLAGSSTLNRLELGTLGQAPSHRYQKVVAAPEELDRLLVDVFLESHRQAPPVLWLDLDAPCTGDPTHRAHPHARTNTSPTPPPPPQGGLQLCCTFGACSLTITLNVIILRISFVPLWKLMIPFFQ